MKSDPTSNIPTVSSNSDTWIQWHKDLKSNFGKKVANSLFIKAWSIRGNSAANTSDLRTYLSKNGITISTSAWDSVVDAGSSAADFFGDIFSVGKYTGMAIIGIAVVGIGMVVYNVGKDPIKALGAVAQLKGGGRK